MKTKIYRYSLLAAALAMTFWLSSCHYKDFDDYEGLLKVKVVIDYSVIDTVSSKPKMMKVVFYPTDKTFAPVSYNIKDSAYVDLPVASYRVFTYNDDSGINRISGIDDITAAPTIYTDPANPRDILRRDSLDDTTYYDWPDRTFTDYRLASVNGDIYTTTPDDNRIVLYPTEVTRRIEVTVDGVRNTKYISSVRLSLDGIQLSYSPLVLLEDTRANTIQRQKYESLVADAGIDAESGKICSAFYAYGFSAGKHYLQLFIKGQGFNKLLRFDVTDQVLSQLETDGTMKIHVNTDYDAYDDYPVDVSGGIGVGVDDWPSEDIPINL